MRTLFLAPETEPPVHRVIDFVQLYCIGCILSRKILALFSARQKMTAQSVDEPVKIAYNESTLLEAEVFAHEIIPGSSLL